MRPQKHKHEIYPEIDPYHVLLGLIFGASFLLPYFLPKINAIESVIHTPMKIERINIGEVKLYNSIKSISEAIQNNPKIIINNLLIKFISDCFLRINRNSKTEITTIE